MKLAVVACMAIPPPANPQIHMKNSMFVLWGTLHPIWWWNGSMQPQSGGRLRAKRSPQNTEVGVSTQIYRDMGCLIPVNSSTCIIHYVRGSWQSLDGDVPSYGGTVWLKTASQSLARSTQTIFLDPVVWKKYIINDWFIHAGNPILNLLLSPSNKLFLISFCRSEQHTTTCQW